MLTPFADNASYRSPRSNMGHLNLFWLDVIAFRVSLTF